MQGLQKKVQPQQSTSSSFYDAKRTLTNSRLNDHFKENISPLNETKTQEKYSYQSIKSSFPELITQVQITVGDRSSILFMQSEINRIRKTLRQCHENIQKISQQEDLKTLVQKMQYQLNQARQKYLIQHIDTKQQVQRLLSSLNQSLALYKKSWNEIKVKSQNQLTASIQSLHDDKLKHQVELTSLLKQSKQKLQDQTNEFTNQLKQNKKLRTQRKDNIIQKLMSVKDKLLRKIDEQQHKRQEYNEIVYGLLEKTCENAQSSLRRRVW